MSNYQSKLFPNTILSIDSSTFTGSYQLVGVLSGNARIVKFTNNSNQLVTLSWDGTNDHEILPPLSFLLIDASANKQGTWGCEVVDGQPFYAKGSAGSGLLYISSYFTH